MLPRTGDQYFNMMQFHDDSLKEALKLKMLNQEDTFKKQVQDLHRLYEIQVMLMKNLQLKEVVSRQSVNNTSQGIFQRPLDAEVSASGYVKHINCHFLNKGDGVGTREMPVEVEHYCPGDTEYSLNEVKLSLSIGGDTTQKRNRRKIWHEKFSSITSQEIIDVEESSQTELSRDIEPMSAIVCTADSRNLYGIKSSGTYVNGMNKDLSNGIKRSDSFADESKSCLEQSSLNQGVTKWLGELPGVGISPVTMELTSHEAACLDLNKPLLDESTFDSKNLAMESSGGAHSGVTERVVGDIHNGTSWRMSNDSCSNEVSATVQQDTRNSTMMASNTDNSRTNTNGVKALSPDLESSFRSLSDCSESHDCLTGNSQHKDAELESNFPRRNHKDKTAIGVNDEKCEKDVVSSHLCSRADAVEDIESSPASCKSDYVATDHSCSLKTVQSGIYSGESYLSRLNSFPNSESSQNGSSSPDESKSGSFDEKKEGSAHDDPLVQRGAVSLMYFLLESSRREQDCDIENGKRDQPQCSADTFESIMLKLQESNVEDDCVCSSHLEVISSDKKDYGIKLRRGRRMKDFQKDILPGLASLSRHEISEDIRIMEGVIRSREYKRLRSKMSSTGHNWFTPVRSRRSRLNYIGRKYYS